MANVGERETRWPGVSGIARSSMSERLQFVTKFWEGVYAADFTLEQVRRRGYRLGDVLGERGWNCLIAHDTRFISNLFARDIYHILAQKGISAMLVSTPAPMPAVQLALDTKQANCALIVSARNRPYWYNGLVLISPGNATLPLQLGDQVALSQPFPPPLIPTTADPADESEAMQDVRTPYIETLRKRVDIDLIRRATLTIFVDPMNGTTSGYIPAILGEGGQTRAIEINREIDPLFNKLTPLPAESSLTRLRKLVRESDSHLGLAFSADGAALGAVDKTATSWIKLRLSCCWQPILYGNIARKVWSCCLSPRRNRALLTVCLN